MIGLREYSKRLVYPEANWTSSKMFAFFSLSPYPFTCHTSVWLWQFMASGFVYCPYSVTHYSPDRSRINRTDWIENCYKDLSVRAQLKHVHVWMFKKSSTCLYESVRLWFKVTLSDNSAEMERFFLQTLKLCVAPCAPDPPHLHTRVFCLSAP